MYRTELLRLEKRATRFAAFCLSFAKPASDALGVDSDKRVQHIASQRRQRVIDLAAGLVASNFVDLVD